MVRYRPAVYQMKVFYELLLILVKSWKWKFPLTQCPAILHSLSVHHKLLCSPSEVFYRYSVPGDLNILRPTSLPPSLPARFSLLVTRKSFQHPCIIQSLKCVLNLEFSLGNKLWRGLPQSAIEPGLPCSLQRQPGGSSLCPFDIRS